MTALKMRLALIPLALGGEPRKEIQTPMAIVIQGRLLISTFLNMVVVPALFLSFSERGSPQSDERDTGDNSKAGTSSGLRKYPSV